MGSDCHSPDDRRWRQYCHFSRSGGKWSELQSGQTHHLELTWMIPLVSLWGALAQEQGEERFDDSVITASLPRPYICPQDLMQNQSDIWGLNNLSSNLALVLFTCLMSHQIEIISIPKKKKMLYTLAFLFLSNVLHSA